MEKRKCTICGKESDAEKNICIVEIMQMLGRKRITVGEKVSAYFYTPALPEMRMSYNILNNKLMLR